MTGLLVGSDVIGIHCNDISYNTPYSLTSKACLIVTLKLLSLSYPLVFVN